MSTPSAQVQVTLPLVFSIEAYGVRIQFEAETERLAELAYRIAAKSLVGRLSRYEGATKDPDHIFRIYETNRGLVFEDSMGPSGPTFVEEDFARSLNSMIRVRVGMNSREWIFVHAGVVGWKGQALLVPADSHQGKTTLVSELVSCGAEYYSDEYAIIDSSGSVHPFERDLSVRQGSISNVVEVPVSTIGGKAGTEPLPAGMVVLTRFEAGSDWQPERISLGEGILETLPMVLSLRFNTEFALKVLNTAFRRAIIVRSSRGEAAKSARKILSYFDNCMDLASKD